MRLRLLALLLTVPVAAAQTPLVVTSTADAGSGTLRAAIDGANAASGADVIAFDIAGAGPHTILPQTPLPEITEAVMIDGLTQPGAGCDAWPATLRVVLDGAQAPSGSAGLVLSGDDVSVRGLVIGGFRVDSPADPVGGNGIRITGDGASVTCTYIGMSATGDAFNRNGGIGIDVVGADGTVIGGSAPSDRVAVTGSFTGIRLSGATAARIEGSYIGPWATGTFGFNNRYGVLVEDGSVGAVIGGSEAGAGNLISGNSRDGVLVHDGATGTVVAGNLIGLAPDGAFAFPNASDGVEVADAPGTVVGGTAPGAGNVISGNDRHGVRLSEGASSVQVQGNYIGTGLDGREGARGNGSGGVFIRGASDNTIGGSAPGAGNVISGNEGIGIEIDGTGGTASGNVVAGNTIGAEVGGVVALGNTDDGVLVENASGNTIGGGTVAAANVIVANGDDGVELFDDGSTGNVVRHNLIGVGSDRETALGNGEDGIDADGAPGNRLADNIIAHNVAAGVAVQNTDAVQVTRNAVFRNGGLGIDLGADGAGANDPGDGDDGPNRRQNTPEFDTATGDGALLSVVYTVDTAASNAAYPLTVELFLADADGEEGQAFLGADLYTTPQQSRTATLVPILSVPDGAEIVATATDADGNTSEFSASATVSGAVVDAEPGAASGIAVRIAASPSPQPRVRLQVSASAAVRLSVVDALGREVRVLHDGRMGAGEHAFDLPGLATGTYAVRVQAEGDASLQRFTVVR